MSARNLGVVFGRQSLLPSLFIPFFLVPFSSSPRKGLTLRFLLQPPSCAPPTGRASLATWQGRRSPSIGSSRTPSWRSRTRNNPPTRSLSSPYFPIPCFSVPFALTTVTLHVHVFLFSLAPVDPCFSATLSLFRLSLTLARYSYPSALTLANKPFEAKTSIRVSPFPPFLPVLDSWLKPFPPPPAERTSRRTTGGRLSPGIEPSRPYRTAREMRSKKRT